MYILTRDNNLNLQKHLLSVYIQRPVDRSDTKTQMSTSNCLVSIVLSVTLARGLEQSHLSTFIKPSSI